MDSGVLLVLTLFAAWCIPFSDASMCSCSYNNKLFALSIQCKTVDLKEIEQCFQRYNETNSLILEKSGLKNVPDSLVLLKNLTFLDLRNNDITRINFSNVNSVCNKIKQLHLDLNDINAIYEGDLDCFVSLERVYLSYNSLSFLQNRAFNEHHVKLRYIHLVHNNLTYLDASMIMLPSLMHKDGHVNASWNDVTQITNDLGFTVEQVNVNMSFGINMIHNNISHVNITHYFQLFNVTDPIHQLYKLWNCGFDVRFNPLVCDCEMYPLAIKLRDFRPMDPDNPLFSITCGHPDPLAGMLVYKVADSDFNCTVEPRCPDNCSCKETIAYGMITVSCKDAYILTDLPNHVPSSKTLRISIKSPWFTRLSPRDYLNNVTELDVSQSSVSTVESSILNYFSSMTSIYLHDNSIQMLPKQIEHLQFGTLKTLTLHGNPYVCDCNTLWVKKWILQNHENIPNQDKIMCGSGEGKGRILVNVPDSEFICDDNFLTGKVQTVGIVAGCFLATVVVVSFVVNRPWFKLFVTEYINPTWCRKKRRMDQLYDVFPSHSSSDDRFVHGELIRRLNDHTPSYKVFIDEKHFIGGKSIAFNINRAIDLSHTTLLILSNEFLRSKWCMMEFRQAHLKLLRDRTINLVIIVIEELNTILIDDELKSYMHNHVYIKRTDKYFWSKLLQALPIRINQTAGESENDTGTSEQCISENGSDVSPLLTSH